MFISVGAPLNDGGGRMVNRAGEPWWLRRGLCTFTRPSAYIFRWVTTNQRRHVVQLHAISGLDALAVQHYDRYQMTLSRSDT
jgi:hypothetical protein